MVSLKDLSKRKEGLCGGHRMCTGCTAPIIVRQVILASEDPVVVCTATGCLEVATTIFPYSAWKVPFIHNAFENAAATISGVESAYQALKKKGKIDKKINFVAFGGDGGTYDIGFQSLSGAVERGHDMLYVCYDNEAYMNTGAQRSSATPKGANTTTAPSGKIIQGKVQTRKDLTECMAAHDMPYVAQAIPGRWNDLARKAETAFKTSGPKFINVLMPCMLGWGFKSDQGLAIARLAIETCFWPLYEVINGEYKLNYKPQEKKPVTEFLKTQARFRHLFNPAQKELLEQIQADVDRKWASLLKKCGE